MERQLLQRLQLDLSFLYNSQQKVCVCECTCLCVMIFFFFFVFGRVWDLKMKLWKENVLEGG